MRLWRREVADTASTQPAHHAADGGAGGRPPLLRELVIGLAVFGVYVLVDNLEWAGRRATADAHAHDIVALERWLHLYFEPSFNQWLHDRPVLETLANYEYAFTYILSAFLLLGWLYARRPAAYRWARNSFVVLNLLGMACFALYPLTPPRLLGGEHDFVDTVAQGGTWGSWGTPLVDHANTLAAMPSLHVAWALWVSVVLAYVAGGRKVQVVSAIHVTLTVYVIVATANHYWLDAVGAAVLVEASVLLVRMVTRRSRNRGEVVAPSDAFFLYVETPAAPQHVGGVTLLDTTRVPGGLTRQGLEDAVRAALPRLPRFRQVLVPGTRWRRARWVDVPVDDLDWGWHVPELAVAPGDRAVDSLDDLTSVRALVARIAETPLPHDRPLWRFALVPDVAPGRAVGIFLVHHVIADGIGAVAQALEILEPRVPLELPGADRRGPSRIARAGLAAAGIGQLATDGAARYRMPGAPTAQRAFTTVTVPLSDVRTAARAHGVTITDVLLTAAAGGFRRAVPPNPTGRARTIKITVPLTIRAPGSTATGNLAAAVIVDVPLDAADDLDRLRRVATATKRLRTPSRALGSRAVMQAAGAALPPVAHAWFARTVYGQRFLHGIVSNMPGPPTEHRLAGAPMIATYPLLPLAPETAFAVGVLGWTDRLCVSLVTDPGLVADPDAMTADFHAVLDELIARSRTTPSPVRA
jgi:hypothetical protein